MRNKILTLVFGAMFALAMPLILSGEEVANEQNKKVRQRSKSERSEKVDRSKKMRKSDKSEKSAKADKKNRKEQLKQRAERARIDFSSMNADEIIQAIEKRQETVLERMRNRNNSLSEKLNMRSERREKMAERSNKDQPKKAKEGKKGKSEDRSKRYESFKENVQNRRAKMAEFAEKRKTAFVKQVSHLEEADQQKVISAYDKLNEQFKAEMETIAADAQKKIEEAFKSAD